MKRIRSIGGSRLAITITAVIVTAVVVAGGLAAALPGTRQVETNDLQTGAVTARTIKNGTVKSRDIRNETIKSKDIQDGTITAADLAPDALSSLEDRITALESERPIVVTNRNDFEAFTTDEVIVSVSLTAPTAGNVTVWSTTIAEELAAGEFVVCSIAEGATTDSQFRQIWQSPGSPGVDSQLAGVRVFEVTAGQTVTYNLVCDNVSGGSSTVFDATLAAMFTPAG